MAEEKRVGSYEPPLSTQSRCESYSAAIFELLQPMIRHLVTAPSLKPCHGMVPSCPCSIRHRSMELAQTWGLSCRFRDPVHFSQPLSGPVRLTHSPQGNRRRWLIAQKNTCPEPAILLPREFVSYDVGKLGPSVSEAVFPE